MASTSGVVSHPVVFTTQTSYPLPSQKFMIPASWRRYQLSQLVNKALSLVKPVPFDFLVRGEILRTTLGEWCAENGVGEVRAILSACIREIDPETCLYYRKRLWRLSILNLSCHPRRCLHYLTKIGYPRSHANNLGAFHLCLRFCCLHIEPSSSVNQGISLQPRTTLTFASSTTHKTLS